MPKDPQVSMRQETYEKLKAEAQKRGLTIKAMLDQILEEAVGKLSKR